MNGGQASVGVPVSLASGAMVTVNPDGTFVYDPAGAFEYLGGGDQASDSFDYTITDGNLWLDSATVSVTVDGVNDAPVLGAVSDVSVFEDASVGVVVSVSDPDAATLVWSLGAGVPGFVSLVDNLDGTATVMVAPVVGDSSAVPYSVTVDVSDGGVPELSDSVMFDVTVDEVPVVSPPVARDDEVSTDEDSVLFGDVLVDNNNGADTDPEFDALTVTLVNGSAANVGVGVDLVSGAIVTVDADGSFMYDPAGAFEVLDAGDQAFDSFTYEITDGNLGFDTATVSVTVDGLTDPVSLRVTDGLLVLYEFGEGGGALVSDTSGVGVPLDLQIADPGAVSWVPGGLSVDSATVISSVGAASKVSDAVGVSNEVTLEVWVEPANVTQTGPARVVGVSSSSTLRNVTLGQGNSGSVPGDRFTARLRTTSTNANGLPSVSTDPGTATVGLPHVVYTRDVSGGVYANGLPSVSTDPGTATVGLTHVVYTRDVSGVVSFYVDGQLVETGAVGGDLSNWDGSYGLHLANEATGGRGWLGRFELVAIYDRALTQTEVDQNFSSN